MSTQFRPLAIPPGVVSQSTKQMQSSNWAEVCNVRWREGSLQPIGGQQQYNYNFASACKAIHVWYDLNEKLYIAYLCESNLYVDFFGSLTEVTPVQGIVPPSLLSGGYGTANYGVGTYGTPRPSNAIPIDRLPDAYSLSNFGAVLLAMTSADGFLLQWDPGLGAPGATGSANATAAWTTAATTINIPGSAAWIKPGLTIVDLTTNQPIGVVQSYADPVLTLTATALHASQGAADLLQASNLATRVVANTGRGIVPTGRCFVVTPERFVLVFGASDATNGGSFRRFAWCDQENYQAWDYANVTSQAGFLDIEPSSPIVCALSTRNGTLFWTGKKTYISQFLGSPYIYNYVELAANCTPWSPQSMVNTTAMALWFSEQGPFSFDGTSVLPIQCMVRRWIDGDIDDLNVREQACAVHVANFNEFWWFFPQVGQPANTRAVIYNYKEGWWSQASMSRSAGVTAAYTSQTIMADGHFAFQHELGNFYGDSALPWAETFDLNITPDSRLITVKQMMPDIKALELTDPDQIANAIGSLRYSLFYRNSRSLGAPELQSLPRPVRSDGYVDFRTTGRDVRLKIEVVTSNVPLVTVGQHLVDAVQRGDR